MEEGIIVEMNPLRNVQFSRLSQCRLSGLPSMFGGVVESRTQSREEQPAFQVGAGDLPAYHSMFVVSAGYVQDCSSTHKDL
jgi:hypothetical protein